ncbi:hypothetical protein A3A49_00415 [Candidatus Curtissbacteria bacterium RIFCSPLOWO2_01_FULL_38_11b]|uniref:Phospholipid/glycerol acyltransferase domain-containing protein n=1 Tax=Candidatus Curtissbacteria bacterium RIFCSPLOWO2_01_FULL_38_11b TaxID=1797725 RepID=A0A1F5H1U9_9BACT|nr:MAG: hypothetical protein A3A49_00415 [Candidatus Curtissbacteria bacterium RIFCSPLOWO2_01_FULL_38_11b]
MKEVLNPVSPEQRPPLIIRNALVAHAIAFVADRILKSGITLEGRELLKNLIIRACHGGRVSISRELPFIYKESELRIEVDGQQFIPSFGSTVFIGNHTRGGPLWNNAQYIEMAKQGYDMRVDVEDEEIREPFVIMQKGLGGWFGKRYATGIFYNLAASALNCEIVSIAKFDRNKHNRDGKEIINHQGLSPTAVQRIIDGGASLWFPQGRHRDPNDFDFPERKANGFLGKVHDRDRHVQLVPLRSIPDSKGNIKIVFGQSVDIGHVVASGGINYFAQKHIVPLG